MKLVRASPEERDTVMDEINRALSIGPGVLVVRGLVSKDVIDRTEEVAKVVHEQWAPFSGAGLSTRTTAFIEKHALTDPESYAEYYGNEVL